MNQIVPLAISLGASTGFLNLPQSGLSSQPINDLGQVVTLAFPALHEGVMCLDDLRTMTVVAIVEPLGNPIIESRSARFERETTKSEIKVAVQKFRVLDSMAMTVGELKVVVPVPTQGNRPIKALRPLAAKAQYLLFADRRVAGELILSWCFQVSRAERFPEWQSYRIPTSDANEYSGWSLVRTDANQLPKRTSREEVALFAVADSIQAKDPEPAHDGVRLLFTISRYSARTEAIHTLDKRRESQEKDLVGELQTDKFFAGPFADQILQRFQGGAGVRTRLLLETLSKWGSAEAKRLLEAPPPTFEGR